MADVETTLRTEHCTSALCEAAGSITVTDAQVENEAAVRGIVVSRPSTPFSVVH